MSNQITLNDVLNNNASQPIKNIYLYLKLALSNINKNPYLLSPNAPARKNKKDPDSNVEYDIVSRGMYLQNKSGYIDMNGPGYDKQRAAGRGRHLHLEVFKTKSENFEESFVTDISKIKKDKKVEVKYENAPIVNPFNFDEPYIKGKQE